jgi:starch phosphorylase
VLTIGFARRFATYKRATLLFPGSRVATRDRLRRQRPVLLLFAGKAHPADIPGQELIQRLVEVGRIPSSSRVLMVEDTTCVWLADWYRAWTWLNNRSLRWKRAAPRA